MGFFKGFLAALALVFLVGAGGQQDEKPSWKYAERKRADIDKLTEYGEMGWELVVAHPDEGETWRCIFKMPR